MWLEIVYRFNAQNIFARRSTCMNNKMTVKIYSIDAESVRYNRYSPYLAAIFRLQGAATLCQLNSHMLRPRCVFSLKDRGSYLMALAMRMFSL